MNMLNRTAGLRYNHHAKIEYSEANRSVKKKQRSIPRSALVSGSITLEAALILPIMILVLVGFMTFFTFMTLEVKMQSALEKAGEKLAAGIYVEDCLLKSGRQEQKEDILTEFGIEAVDLAVTAVTAKGLVTHEMGGFFADASIVRGGMGGVSFAGSYYDRISGDVVLKAGYSVKIPLFPFEGLSIPVSQQAVLHGWTGKPLSKRSDEELVYFTEYGTVYHTHLDCSYLKLSISEIRIGAIAAKRNADGGRYSECEVCGSVGGETVFVTSYGDRYHFDRNCSGLKRGIKSAPIGAAGNREECSKCRKRDTK